MSELEMSIFGQARLQKEKLGNYGFIENEGSYQWHTSIHNGDFELAVIIKKDGTVDSNLIDLATGDPYVLYKLPNAHGDYVGSIRDEIKEVLKDIRAHCYLQGSHTSDAFFFLRDYCHATYNESLEYLWDDDNCILRRQDNRKWYAVICRVSLQKLGINEEKIASVLVLRGNPLDIDGRTIFPGYHLNKKSWVSMVLDERSSKEEIARRIDASRELALGKRK